MNKLIANTRLLAPALLAIAVLFMAAGIRLEPLPRGLASIVALALLVLQWARLRHSMSLRPKLYMTAVLLFPALAACWFGLNQVRVHFYNGGIDAGVYGWTVRGQTVIERIAALAFIGLVAVAICDAGYLLPRKWRTEILSARKIR